MVVTGEAAPARSSSDSLSTLCVLGELSSELDPTHGHKHIIIRGIRKKYNL